MQCFNGRSHYMYIKYVTENMNVQEKESKSNGCDFTISVDKTIDLFENTLYNVFIHLEITVLALGVLYSVLKLYNQQSIHNCI